MNMFNENDNTDLIIVYNDKKKGQEQYAKRLQDLIMTHDDKENGEIVGTVDGTTAKVWTECQYKDNEINIAPSQKVLFVGDTDDNKNQILPYMNTPKNSDIAKYGIKYGWSGNRAFLFVDQKYHMSKENYKIFLEEINKEKALNGLIDKKKTGKNIKKYGMQAVATGAIWGLLPFVWIGVGGGFIAKNVYDNKQALKAQQYYFGIYYFYKYHLRDFLNDNIG